MLLYVADVRCHLSLCVVCGVLNICCADRCCCVFSVAAYFVHCWCWLALYVVVARCC